MKECKGNTEKIRLMEQNLANLEHSKAKHKTDMADLRAEEQSITDHEIPSLQSEVFETENELIITEQRLQNIKNENEQFLISHQEYTKMIQNVQGF